MYVFMIHLASVESIFEETDDSKLNSKVEHCKPKQ